MEHPEEKLHNLDNIENGVNDDDGSPSSRNEDVGMSSLQVKD